MTPSTLNSTLEDLIMRMSKPKVQRVRTLGSQIEHNALVGYEPPSFEMGAFDHLRPQIVGSIGDHEVRVDTLLKFPRMVVSKKFRDMFPEQANDLQTWMGKFFGFDYPVYVENKTIILHPDALQRLVQKLGGVA